MGNYEVLQTIDLLPDLREYLLWNGDYRHRYEPFCTLRCCEEYAKIVFLMTEFYRDPAFAGNEAEEDGERERQELLAQQQAVEVATQHWAQQDKEAES